MSDPQDNKPLSGNDPEGPPQLNMANCCCSCRCRGPCGSDGGDASGDTDPEKTFFEGPEGIERPPSAASHRIIYHGLCPACEEDQVRLGRYRAIRQGVYGFEYVHGVESLSDEGVSRTGRREPAVDLCPHSPNSVANQAGNSTEPSIAGSGFRTRRSDSGSEILRGAGYQFVDRSPQTDTPYFFSPNSPPLSLVPCLRLPPAMLLEALESEDMNFAPLYPLEIDMDDCQ